MTPSPLRRLSLAPFTALALVACQAPAAPGGPSPTPAPSGLSLQAGKQLAVGKAPHGIAAAHGFIYNADTGADQLSVIDTATQAVVKTLPFGEGTPGYLKAFRDGHHVLAADTRQGSLRVIDPAQGHQTLQTITIGAGIDQIVIDDDDRTVFVSLTEEPRVVKLAFAGDRALPPTVTSIAVGGVVGAEFKHRALAAGGGWLVVPNSADNDTSLVNLATGAAQRVMLGNNPGPVGIGTAGETAVAAIVGYKASNAIGLFELPGGTPTRLDHVGLTPSDLAVDPGLGRAYVTMAGSNDVAVVDYVARKLLGRVPVGKRPVHIAMAPPLPAPPPSSGASTDAPAAHEHTHYRVQDHPAPALSHELWVGNDDGGSVTVFDGETLRIKATIATGAGHHKLAFHGGFAYVSNLNDATVSVIDRAAIR